MAKRSKRIPTFAEMRTRAAAVMAPDPMAPPSELAAPTVEESPPEEPGYLESIRGGYGASLPGLAAQLAARGINRAYGAVGGEGDLFDVERMQRESMGVEGELPLGKQAARAVGQLGGEAPLFAAGGLTTKAALNQLLKREAAGRLLARKGMGAIAKVAVPSAVSAGAFTSVGVPREILREQVAGEPVQPGRIAKEAVREAATGAAIGPLARVRSPLLRLPAEVGVLTGAGAAFHGEAPGLDDLILNAGIVGVMHATGAATNPVRARAALDRIATGYRAKKLIEAAKDIDPEDAKVVLAATAAATGNSTSPSLLAVRMSFVPERLQSDYRRSYEALAEARRTDNPNMKARAMAELEQVEAEVRREFALAEPEIRKAMAAATRPAAPPDARGYWQQTSDALADMGQAAQAARGGEAPRVVDRRAQPLPERPVPGQPTGERGSFGTGAEANRLVEEYQRLDYELRSSENPPPARVDDIVNRMRDLGERLAQLGFRPMDYRLTYGGPAVEGPQQPQIPPAEPGIVSRAAGPPVDLVRAGARERLAELERQAGQETDKRRRAKLGKQIESLRQAIARPRTVKSRGVGATALPQGQQLEALGATPEELATPGMRQAPIAMPPAPGTPRPGSLLTTEPSRPFTFRGEPSEQMVEAETRDLTDRIYRALDADAFRRAQAASRGAAPPEVPEAGLVAGVRPEMPGQDRIATAWAESFQAGTRDVKPYRGVSSPGRSAARGVARRLGWSRRQVRDMPSAVLAEVILNKQGPESHPWGSGQRGVGRAGTSSPRAPRVGPKPGQAPPSPPPAPVALERPSSGPAAEVGTAAVGPPEAAAAPEAVEKPVAEAKAEAKVKPSVVELQAPEGWTPVRTPKGDTVVSDMETIEEMVRQGNRRSEEKEYQAVEVTKPDGSKAGMAVERPRTEPAKLEIDPESRYATEDAEALYEGTKQQLVGHLTALSKVEAEMKALVAGRGGTTAAIRRANSERGKRLEKDRDRLRQLWEASLSEVEDAFGAATAARMERAVRDAVEARPVPAGKPKPTEAAPEPQPKKVDRRAELLAEQAKLQKKLKEKQRKIARVPPPIQAEVLGPIRRRLNEIDDELSGRGSEAPETAKGEAKPAVKPPEPAAAKVEAKPPLVPKLADVAKFKEGDSILVSDGPDKGKQGKVVKVGGFWMGSPMGGKREAVVQYEIELPDGTVLKEIPETLTGKPAQAPARDVFAEAEFKQGDRVELVGGSHRGKTGVVTRLYSPVRYAADGTPINEPVRYEIKLDEAGQYGRTISTDELALNVQRYKPPLGGIFDKIKGETAGELAKGLEAAKAAAGPKLEKLRAEHEEAKMAVQPKIDELAEEKSRLLMEGRAKNPELYYEIHEMDMARVSPEFKALMDQAKVARANASKMVKLRRRTKYGSPKYTEYLNKEGDLQAHESKLKGQMAELKRAMLRKGEHRDLWQTKGEPSIPRVEEIRKEIDQLTRSYDKLAIARTRAEAYQAEKVTALEQRIKELSTAEAKRSAAEKLEEMFGTPSPDVAPARLITLLKSSRNEPSARMLSPEADEYASALKGEAPVWFFGGHYGSAVQQDAYLRDMADAGFIEIRRNADGGETGYLTKKGANAVYRHNRINADAREGAPLDSELMPNASASELQTTGDPRYAMNYNGQTVTGTWDRRQWFTDGFKLVEIPDTKPSFLKSARYVKDTEIPKGQAHFPKISEILSYATDDLKSVEAPAQKLGLRVTNDRGTQKVIIFDPVATNTLHAGETVALNAGYVVSIEKLWPGGKWYDTLKKEGRREGPIVYVADGKIRALVMPRELEKGLSPAEFVEKVQASYESRFRQVPTDPPKPKRGKKAVGAAALGETARAARAERLRVLAEASSYGITPKQLAARRMAESRAQGIVAAAAGGKVSAEPRQATRPKAPPPKRKSKLSESAVEVPADGIDLTMGERQLLSRNGQSVDEAGDRMLGRKRMSEEDYAKLNPNQKLVHVVRRLHAANNVKEFMNVLAAAKYRVGHMAKEDFALVMQNAARRVGKDGIDTGALPAPVARVLRKIDGPAVSGFASGLGLSFGEKTSWYSPLTPARYVFMSEKDRTLVPEARLAQEHLKNEWNAINEILHEEVFRQAEPIKDAKGSQSWVLRGRIKPNSTDDAIIWSLLDNAEGHPDYLNRPTVKMAHPDSYSAKRPRWNVGDEIEVKPYHRRSAKIIHDIMEDLADRQSLPPGRRRKNYVTHLMDRMLDVQKVGAAERAKLHELASAALKGDYKAVELDTALGPELTRSKYLQLRDYLQGKEPPKSWKRLRRKIEILRGVEDLSSLPDELRQPFLEQRKGGRPVIQSASVSVEAYLRYALRKIYFEPLVEKWKPYVESLPGRGAKVPALLTSKRQYAEDYFSHILGRPSRPDLVWNQLRESILARLGPPTWKNAAWRWAFKPNLFTRGSTALTRLQYVRLLGLAFDSAVLNLLQGANTFATLGLRNSLRGYGRYLFAPDFRRAVAQARLMDEFRPFFSGPTDVTRLALTRIEKAILSPFTLAERVNRGAAFAAGLAEAKARGLEFKRGLRFANLRVSRFLLERDADKAQIVSYSSEAIEHARARVVETQFGYSPVESAPILGHPGGRAALQFWSFPTQQLALFYDGVAGAARRHEHGRVIRTLALLGWTFGFGQFVANRFGLDVTNIWSPFGIIPRSLGPNVQLARKLWDYLPVGVAKAQRTVGMAPPAVGARAGWEKQIERELVKELGPRSPQLRRAIEAATGVKVPGPGSRKEGIYEYLPVRPVEEGSARRARRPRRERRATQ